MYVRLCFCLWVVSIDYGYRLYTCIPIDVFNVT